MLLSDRVHRAGGLLIRIGLAGFLGMIWLLELIRVFDDREGFDLLAVPYLIPGLVAIALVLFPEGRMSTWPIPLTALSALMSVAAGILYPLAQLPFIAETGALLVLVTWTVRGIDTRNAKTVAVLLLVALLATPLRSDGTNTGLGSWILIFMALTVAVAVGAYLYSVDARRRRAISTVRHGERLELARELHDFVAHHVTGIVVQAQAAQYIPHDEPAQVRESFAAIEKAGLEALTSMRRLVDVMRQEDSGAGARPLGDLEQTVELVDRFRHGDAVASLHVASELTPGSLAPEVAASIHRIVQEGLTNVRKHAAGVTAVTVAVTSGTGGVEVAVRDDGHPAGGNRLSTSGGGFGLEGLHERVTAIDGRLSAGPRPEGGWEIVARLPATAPGRRAAGSIGDDRTQEETP